MNDQTTQEGRLDNILNRISGEPHVLNDANRISSLSSEILDRFENSRGFRNPDYHPVGVHARVDELICWLVPSSIEQRKRSSAIELLREVITKSLGAQSFLIGAISSNTYLPTEVIQITSFLCEGQKQNWFVRVHENLCRTNTPTSDNIQRISYSFIKSRMEVMLNDVTIEISANELSSLYISSIMEEFNNLVGSDNLFKRTFILIKSWIHYEAPRVIPELYGDPLDPVDPACPLLSHHAILVLTILLFCRCSSAQDPIKTPLQGLYFFLKLVAEINWNEAIVTATGIYKEADDYSRSLQETVSPSDSAFAFLTDSARDIIAKVQDRNYTCMQSSMQTRRDLNTQSSFPEEITTDSQRDANSSFVDASFSQHADLSFGVDLNLSEQQPMKHLTVSAPLQQGNTSDNSFERTLHEQKAKYSRSKINIMDPVQPYTNLCSKLNPKVAACLPEVWRKGLEACAGLFQELSKSSDASPESSSERVEADYVVVDLLRRFFVNTFTLLTKSVRPEEVASPSQVLRILDSINCEELDSHIRHAELILGSRITADAVVQLIVHYIELKGPQPIGELGKLLQDATGNPGLSKILKSQFHGLKRLIEAFPNLLKLGGDHSFNPHVHLARPPSKGGMGMGTTGVISVPPLPMQSLYPRSASAASSPISVSPVSSSSSNPTQTPPATSSDTIATVRVDSDRYVATPSIGMGRTVVEDVSVRKGALSFAGSGLYGQNKVSISQSFLAHSAPSVYQSSTGGPSPSQLPYGHTPSLRTGSPGAMFGQSESALEALHYGQAGEAAGNESSYRSLEDPSYLGAHSRNWSDTFDQGGGEVGPPYPRGDFFFQSQAPSENPNSQWNPRPMSSYDQGPRRPSAPYSRHTTTEPYGRSTEPSGAPPASYFADEFSDQQRGLNAPRGGPSYGGYSVWSGRDDGYAHGEGPPGHMLSRSGPRGSFTGPTAREYGQGLGPGVGMEMGMDFGGRRSAPRQSAFQVDRRRQGPGPSHGGRW